MNQQQKINQLLKKVEQVTHQQKLDLSSDEDLSIAVMNLISIEEHLFFTAEKTGKKHYYQLLKEVRELRKQLLKKLIRDYEGEVWCISKHLLAASMRLIEVGTKQLGQGEKKSAYDLFAKAYQLYSLFWGINLKLVKLDSKKPLPDNNKLPGSSSIFDKLGQIVKKIVDCCKE